MRFVPANRLLLWTGLVFLPATTIAAMVPQAWIVCYAVLALFILVAIADILFSRDMFDGIRVALPEIVRMAKGRDTRITVVVSIDHSKIRHLRLGILFPRHIASDCRDLHVELPAGNKRLSLPWPLKALKRGRYRLDTCCLETASCLGFWAVRHTVDIHCEIRAYPDLLVERQTLAAFFMKNNCGIHAQHQVGKGRDFERLREYMPGDSFEDIHWKATAKRGAPISKIYQIEKTQNIYVVIDASRLGARDAETFNKGLGTPEPNGLSRQLNTTDLQDTILEKYITAALAVGMAAERQGDNFGIAAFSDHVSGFLKAKTGHAHYQSCRDVLYLLENHKVTPDFTELCTTLASKIRKRSLLIFLTCLDDPTLAENFLQNMKMLCKRHLVMVNMLKPALANPLFAGQVQGMADDLYRHLAGHFLWESLARTNRSLHRMGVDFALLDNDKMCLQLITQYLNIKKRQVL